MSEEEPVRLSPEATPDARRRVLDAAAEAFMASGFANATIDEIARDVGATKGLVYYHFRSKFDIFLTVYEESMHRVRERVEPHTKGQGNGRERLIAMSIAHELNLMEDFAYHHVVHQAVRGEMSTALKPRQRDALAVLNQLRRDYEQMFRVVVAEGVEDGSLRKVDVPLATRTLLSNLNAVDLWYHPNPDQPADELHDLACRIVDLLIGGIAVR
ncbi:TetR/AcrR family transcriptional regulator [Actinoplanes sp. NPDC026623]|uniref:TetR/AcrR family transcriptional regulator n=1 Tax=Actinoplanes sp. NPDC026623 TaxID=3155610 RepID=UPI0033E07BF8